MTEVTLTAAQYDFFNQWYYYNFIVDGLILGAILALIFIMAFNRL